MPTCDRIRPGQARLSAFALPHKAELYQVVAIYPPSYWIILVKEACCPTTNMNKIEVIRKETPPIAVRDLVCELDQLTVLLDQWERCKDVRSGNRVFNEITGRLHPNLMRALVMIAQKQTNAILGNRKRVALTFLGRVRIHNEAKHHFLQWLDVFVSEERIPLLRRVAISPQGMNFYALTWSGWASISCAHPDLWDKERKIWRWDSAEGDTSANLLRDGVLPRIPLRMQENETCEVAVWPKHLEFTSVKSLLEAVDRFGEGRLHELEKAEALALLEKADSDLNPLWSHLLREGEWE